MSKRRNPRCKYNAFFVRIWRQQKARHRERPNRAVMGIMEKSLRREVCQGLLVELERSGSGCLVGSFGLGDALEVVERVLRVVGVVVLDGIHLTRRGVEREQRVGSRLAYFHSF